MAVPNDFDWMVYCTYNRDLWDADIRTEQKCIVHWKYNGKNEKRTICFTDCLEEQYNIYVDTLHDSVKKDRLLSLNSFFSENQDNNISITDNNCLDTPNYDTTTIHDNIAVILHLGNIDMWSEMDIHLKELGNIKFDLWITIPRVPNLSDGNIDEITEIIMNSYINANIIVVPNSGFDIGGFFYALDKIFKNKLKYDFILKLQTKSDDTWRHNMIKTYVGKNLMKNIIFLKNNRNVGMIGWKPKVISFYMEPEACVHNEYHINRIMEHMYGKITGIKYSYVSGTMFWCRASVLYDIFYDKLDWFISNLNDRNSIDINWIKINKENKIGNLLWDCAKEKQFIRDGMFEHAVERFFGYAFIHSGYKIIGVDNEVNDNYIVKYSGNNLFNNTKIYLISHDNVTAGAQIFLNNLFNYLSEELYNVQIFADKLIGDPKKNGNFFNFDIKTPESLIWHIISESLDINKYIQNMLLSGQTLKTDKDAIEHFIKNETIGDNMLFFKFTPIVFVNTLVLSKYIKALSRCKIKTFWIIHEWIDINQPITTFMNDVDAFTLSLKNIYVCDASRKNLAHLKQSPYTIIHNGISETQLFKQKNQKIHEKYIKTSKTRILLIGVICDRKNQLSFIKNVFETIIHKHNNIELFIVGGPIDNIILSKITEYEKKYKDTIILPGHFKNPIPFIDSSDIVVSYSNNEVFPLSLIESMYCGKSIISTDVGGIREMITHEHDGLLFAPNDSDACISHLDRLLCDKEYAIKLGNNAKNTYNDKFEIRRTFHKYIDIINEHITPFSLKSGSP
jgi:glycosyltransferase involved in cell wall biosynthesis